MRQTIRQIEDWTSAHRAALLIAVLILITGVAVSVFFAQIISSQNNRDFTARLVQQRSSIKSNVTSSFDKYNQLILAASTYTNATGRMTDDKWSQFFDDMQVSSRYPDMLGIGYVTYLYSDKVEEFEAYTSNELGEPFNISPNTQRDIYTAITYLKPDNAVNKKALGFDMRSEKTRRTVMDSARDNATIGLSGPVKLVQDMGSKQARPGVLLYCPIYDSAKTPTTVQERRDKIKGYVYIVLRPADVIERYMLTSWLGDAGTATTIKDVTEATAKDIYSNDKLSHPLGKLQTFSDIFTVGDRQWRITVQGRDTAYNTTYVPGMVMLLGIGMSMMISYTMLRVLLQRLISVQQHFHAEVQRSKDELVALASHQLRTPASGVKMYIGMLYDGMAGELTPDQRAIVKKAYDTNERQIDIVNELLYVSKLDAGQLHLDLQDIDIIECVTKQVETLTPQAEEKNIVIRFRGKGKIKLKADANYISMIIENLISNAIKYSPVSSVIMVKFSKTTDEVVLSVIDKGVGIPADQQDKVFEKFTRVNNEFSRAEGGTGLGLYLSRELARAHGGSLKLISTEGKGSTFSLHLPQKL